MIGRWIRTVSHLEASQLVSLLKFRLHRPRPLDCDPPPLRELSPAGWATLPLASQMTGPHQFRLLNEDVDLDLEGWEPPARSRLLHYHLHYFDDLCASGAEQREDWHRQLLDRWIGENPAPTGPGWEPYPLATRIINWTRWSLRHALEPQVVRSLANQLRYLERRVEHHLTGNHLLRNAVGLISGGLRFRGEEARRWFHQGLQLLLSELDQQILADGGHYERSPMYQGLILQDLGRACQLFRAAGKEPPSAVVGAAEAMLSWLDQMTHPDGEIGFFNDAAVGMAPAPGPLRSFLASAGIKPAPRPEPLCGGGWSCHHLAESGYFRVEGHDAVALLDVAPLGPDHLPAHGHADTLSFELSIGTERVVVNSGTGLYEPGAECCRPRGTAAHSTVVIDGKDSSETWASFRVGRRARVRDVSVRVEKDGLTVGASHDGYRFLAGAPAHRRRWRFSRRSLTVTDEISGGGDHQCAARYHLAPEVVVRRDSGIEITAGALRLRMDAPRDVSIEPSVFCPEFGLSEKSSALLISADGPLPQTLEATLRW